MDKDAVDDEYERDVKRGVAHKMAVVEHLTARYDVIPVAKRKTPATFTITKKLQGWVALTSSPKIRCPILMYDRTTWSDGYSTAAQDTWSVNKTLPGFLDLGASSGPWKESGNANNIFFLNHRGQMMFKLRSSSNVFGTLEPLSQYDGEDRFGRPMLIVLSKYSVTTEYLFD